MRVPHSEMPKARIEIIPMIDVIFFLLVFFMVSTLSMTINRGLPVNLPAAGSAPSSVRDNVTLTLTQDGGIFLDKEPISRQDIVQRVQMALAASPQLTVLINADGQVRHSSVVEVLDTLRLAGVSALAIAVKPDNRPLSHP
jgi:biopolymer transport protein ExbD